MKQLTFSFLLFFIPYCLSAQSERDSVDVFCTIASYYKLYGKYQTTVDYGRKTASKKKRSLQDEKETDIDREEFTSMAEAMNYLTVRGWMYVEIYGVSLGESWLVNYCLMRKKVPVSEAEKD